MLRTTDDAKAALREIAAKALDDGDVDLAGNAYAIAGDHAAYITLFQAHDPVRKELGRAAKAGEKKALMMTVTLGMSENAWPTMLDAAVLLGVTQVITNTGTVIWHGHNGDRERAFLCYLLSREHDLARQAAEDDELRTEVVGAVREPSLVTLEVLYARCCTDGMRDLMGALTAVAGALALLRNGT